MRKWVLLGLVLALAACNGKDSDKKTPQPALTPTGVDMGTEEAVDSSYELVPLEPGVRVQSGLTLVTSSQGEQDGTVYFFGEVRNDTGQMLSWLNVLIYPLDDLNLQVGTIDASSMLSEIPPGETVYVGSAFPAPENYTDSQIWVRFETAPSTLEPFFNLPVTIDSSGPGDNVPYKVTGTAVNTTGKELAFPVIDAVLIGPDDNLVGYARGIMTTSKVGQIWPAGETATFEATFGFMAAEISQITDVRVSLVAYAQMGSQ